MKTTNMIIKLFEKIRNKINSFTSSQ